LAFPQGKILGTTFLGLSRCVKAMTKAP
jgi:hypothetical protein